MASQLFDAYKFVSWQDLLDRYLEERTDLEETTIDNNRRRLGEFCRWLDEKKVIPSDLTSARQASAIKKFLDGPKAHVAPRTRKNYVLLAHRFFAFASGDIEGLPDYAVLPEKPEWKCGSKQLAKVPPDHAYCLSRADFEKVLAHIQANKAKHDLLLVARDLALVLTAGTAGLRREELTNLVWSEVTFPSDDPNKTTFHIVHGKGNKDRKTHSWDPRCRAALIDLKKRLVEHDAWFASPTRPVFFSTKFCGDATALDRTLGPLQPASIGRFFQQVSEALTKDPEEPFRVTAHSLRHRFARTLHDDGVSLMTIKSLLGHSDVATTQRYIEASAEDAEAQGDAVYAAKAPRRKAA